ncbi:cytochrome c family protein [Amaricoccus sp.]|uniref:c-type cytochrome n=1 Tax=Amaricoccus sp. TaxID=1872485 RepID=UPI0025B9B27E|nr:cytochrome c family protein [Amaricoccus sp.]
MPMKLARFALAAAPLVVWAAAAAAQDAPAGDVAAGEKVFRKCAACHTLDPSGKSRVGPDLYGVVGRTTGTLEGFKYSEAMTKAGEEGHVWTVEELDLYLENPKTMLPGNKMTFVGLKKPEERADVIAYIQSVSGG